MILATKLESVLSANPCVIVEDLKCFTGAPARQAEGSRAQIVECTAVEIDLRQSRQPGPEIDSKCRRINKVRISGCRVSRIKAGGESRIPEPYLIQFLWGKGSQPTGGYHLHLSGRELFKGRNARTAPIIRGPEWKSLVAFSKGIATCDGVIFREIEIHFGDQIVSVVGVTNGVRKRVVRLIRRC